MEIVYPRACGVDVHKSLIVAVICISESIKPRYIKKRFSTFNNQLIQFRDWLIENNCHNVCMESTGKYYIPVYNALEGHIPNVVVANPKWVKAIKGEKDDNKDAKWIADLFKFGIVRSSYIPEKDIRILREFTRYQYKLVNIRSSEKNRFQNALTVANLILFLLMSLVNLLPLLSIPFYQMNPIQVKIFFPKFMEGAKLLQTIFFQPLKEPI